MIEVSSTFLKASTHRPGTHPTCMACQYFFLFFSECGVANVLGAIRVMYSTVRETFFNPDSFCGSFLCYLFRFLHKQYRGNARRIFTYMSTRTDTDRANAGISGAKLTKDVTIKVDPEMIVQCETAGLFHRGHRTATSPTLSQWCYDAMVKATEEEKTIQLMKEIAARAKKSRKDIQLAIFLQEQKEKTILP